MRVRSALIPNRIAAIGESAGANLAALLGTSSVTAPGGGPSSSSAVDAVVAFSTPTDLTSLQTESPLAAWAAAQFLGGTPEQIPAKYIAASPLDNVSAGDPPMLSGAGSGGSFDSLHSVRRNGGRAFARGSSQPAGAGEGRP